MTANRHRGEVPVTLGGQDYVLRPTFEAICEAEERTGVKLIPLGILFERNEFGARDAAAVLHALLRAGGAKLSLDEVGRAIVAEGVMRFRTPIYEALRAAALGGKEPEGNAEAAPGSQPTGSTGAA